MSSVCLLDGIADIDNPLHRYRAYLVSQGWWTEAEEKALLASHKKAVMAAFQRAEKLPKPKLGELFTDVWAVKKGEEAPAVIVGTSVRVLLITV